MGLEKLLIILPEIYGRNNFIEDEISYYRARNFDVICPDYYSPFTYDEKDLAYECFREKLGFEIGWLVELIVSKKSSYEEIYLLGFSVGASLAWRASHLAHGTVAVYGSRIRDYLQEEPGRILVVLSRDEAFDLQGAIRLDGPHGFMDSYGPSYDRELAQKCRRLIDDFLDGSK